MRRERDGEVGSEGEKMLQGPRLSEALEPLSYNLTAATPTPPLERVAAAPDLGHHLRPLTSHYGTMSLCKLLWLLIAVK